MPGAVGAQGCHAFRGALFLNGDAVSQLGKMNHKAIRIRVCVGEKRCVEAIFGNKAVGVHGELCGIRSGSGLQRRPILLTFGCQSEAGHIIILRRHNGKTAVHQRAQRQIACLRQINAAGENLIDRAVVFALVIRVAAFTGLASRGGCFILFCCHSEGQPRLAQSVIGAGRQCGTLKNKNQRKQKAEHSFPILLFHGNSPLPICPAALKGDVPEFTVFFEQEASGGDKGKARRNLRKFRPGADKASADAALFTLSLYYGWAPKSS